MRAIAWLIFYGLLGVGAYFAYPYVKGPMFAWLDEEDPFIRKILLADGSPIRINLRKLTADDFPPLVSLASDVEARLPDGSATRLFNSGSKLKPVRYYDGRVTLEDDTGGFMAEIAVGQTDFAKLTLDNMVARIKATMESEGVIFASEDFSEEDSEAVEKEKIVEEKVVEEVVEEDPNKRIELPKGELTPEEIVIAMQQYVEDEKVTEFTYDQVEEWDAGEDEEIDGKSVQTGTVTVTSQTVFGSESTKKAKAIIVKGRVRRMIWPKSGFEVE